MKAYYFKSGDYGRYDAHIIDEATFQQAERGGNYLCADDYDFLCDAASYEDARRVYWEEVSQNINAMIGEADHP